LILRPWRLVPWLRQLNRWLGMPSGQVRGISSATSARKGVRKSSQLISQELGSDYDYRLGLYEMEQATPGRRTQRLLHRARSRPRAMSI
jgi:hypothetical protein